jgi:hypothetical protein
MKNDETQESKSQGLRCQCKAHFKEFALEAGGEVRPRGSQASGAGAPPECGGSASRPATGSLLVSSVFCQYVAHDFAQKRGSPYTSELVSDLMLQLMEMDLVRMDEPATLA